MLFHVIILSRSTTFFNYLNVDYDNENTFWRITNYLWFIGLTMCRLKQCIVYDYQMLYHNVKTSSFENARCTSILFKVHSRLIQQQTLYVTHKNSQHSPQHTTQHRRTLPWPDTVRRSGVESSLRLLGKRSYWGPSWRRKSWRSGSL